MSDLHTPDDLGPLFEQLAPDIDIDRAHRSLQVQRRRRANRRRALTATVAVAVILVPLGLALIGSGSDRTLTTAAEPEPAPANTFPLPAPGEADSILLDDGMPAWIVNHGDGTASAVPAVHATTRSMSPLSDQVVELVSWHPTGVFQALAPSHVKGKALTWDTHGRAITADADLAGLSATVEDDRVHVQHTGATTIAGQADEPKRENSDDDVRQVPPTLPPTVDPDQLGPGWHTVDADLVIVADGTARLCGILSEQVPVPGAQPTCPPIDLQIRTFDLDGYTEFRLLGPLLVHVTPTNVLDLVHADRFAGTVADDDFDPDSPAIVLVMNGSARCGAAGAVSQMIAAATENATLLPPANAPRTDLSLVYGADGTTTAEAIAAMFDPPLGIAPLGAAPIDTANLSPRPTVIVHIGDDRGRQYGGC